MDKQLYLEKSIEQALEFIESVKIRLLELKGNHDQIQALHKERIFSYKQSISNIIQEKILYISNWKMA